MNYCLSVGFCLFLFFQSFEGQSQDNLSSDEFCFMFYNSENFFDCNNDSLTNDDEFTPKGVRGWNWKKFQGKADRLAKVILAAGKWNAPVLVGLSEIENLYVLEYLTKKTSLRNYNYKIVHKDSPDLRGIDVALIYRPELFLPFDYQAIAVTDSLNKSFYTRDILQVSGVLNGCDTIHIFVNHWPSRYGGVMETEKYRSLASETLRRAIQTINFKYRNAKIICMGDFNDNPLDESLAKLLVNRKSEFPDNSGKLVNLSSDWVSGKVQTLKNQYAWDVFDQFIVSDNILTDTSCFQFRKAEIFHPEFLLEPDTKFGGVKPRRSFIGFKYQEGFSDHLPVLLQFQMDRH